MAERKWEELPWWQKLLGGLLAVVVTGAGVAIVISTLWPFAVLLGGAWLVQKIFGSGKKGERRADVEEYDPIEADQRAYEEWERSFRERPPRGRDHRTGL